MTVIQAIRKFSRNIRYRPLTVALCTTVISNAAFAHNADKLREARKRLTCEHLETLDATALEKAGSRAVSRRKLCDVKRQLRESRERREENPLPPKPITVPSSNDGIAPST